MKDRTKNIFNGLRKLYGLKKNQNKYMKHPII